MNPFPGLFEQMAALLMLAAAVGAIGVRLRQPLIVAFIVVGILVGPALLNWVSANDQIDLLAQLGITLLLFVVGLRLDLHIIRTMGLVALATGLGQVLFTSLIGYVLARQLGMEPVAALYVAVALTFSSTIIIVKLLSDLREVDTLHGRIALGFLIVQDIVVVVVMIGLNALDRSTGQALPVAAAWVLFKGLAFTAGVGLSMRYVLPGLLRLLSRSAELLVLFGIAWAVTLAILGMALGFSKEVGAFAAGVSLASGPYREALGARLVSVRDFLLLFFFIDLGARLDLALLDARLIEALILSVFVLIGNPLIVMVILGLMGYRKRTSFLAGLTVAQISEFSLILGALGLSLGHIDPETMGLITLVGMITISASTYMIIYSHRLYDLLAPWLGLFERRQPYRESEDNMSRVTRADVVLFGVGRYGSRLAAAIRARGATVLCVDHNPEFLHQAARSDDSVYGDAENPDFVAALPLDGVRWVVSALRDRPVNLALIRALRDAGFRGRIAVSANHGSEAGQLIASGADLVLDPFTDAAIDAAQRLFPPTTAPADRAAPPPEHSP